MSEDKISKENWEIIRMRRRRDLINSNKHARQLAVCEFPLKVANLAKSMYNLIRLTEITGDRSPEVEANLNYMEEIIRQHYKQQFGCEMG